MEQSVRVTDAHDSDNVYPAFTQQYNAALQHRDREACYVIQLDNTNVPLAKGRYPARLVGSYKGLPLYATGAGTSVSTRASAVVVQVDTICNALGYLEIWMAQVILINGVLTRGPVFLSHYAGCCDCTGTTTTVTTTTTTTGTTTTQVRQWYCIAQNPESPNCDMAGIGGFASICSFSCMLLSAAELADLLMFGYQLFSGPWPSVLDCYYNCTPQWYCITVSGITTCKYLTKKALKDLVDGGATLLDGPFPFYTDCLHTGCATTTTSTTTSTTTTTRTTTTSTTTTTQIRQWYCLAWGVDGRPCDAQFMGGPPCNWYCLWLTANELADLYNFGYTIFSGPWPDNSTCLYHCSPHWYCMDLSGVRSCMYLTQADYDAAILAGYTYVAGSFNNYIECYAYGCGTTTTTPVPTTTT